MKIIVIINDDNKNLWAAETSFGREMTTVQSLSICKRKYIYLSTYQEISQGTQVYLDIVGNSHIAPTPACKNANIGIGNTSSTIVSDILYLHIICDI